MTVTLCPKCNGTGIIEAPEGHFMRGIVYQCDCGTPRKHTVRRKLAQQNTPSNFPDCPHNPKDLPCWLCMEFTL